MKTLELNEMEIFFGGNAACVGAVASGVGVVFDTVGLIVGVASGPLGWGLLAVGLVGLVASSWGDPCANV
ncbi:hypothetical protein F7018_04905 [Tenacibaculum aiptasiae]|uniref:Uncharacterized protein n=1 Tax=Tenacibaculum aiptasiae TaxID=426481 RepID=A0A7J5AQ66_9FLAO|nr:hypothetical protein [Tenacibaculum aiptasiae]KAB1159652.1 hypothetical protein F7018_04905 [Tenacibaculum aiptasiae]